jgi:hypothetical protein
MKEVQVEDALQYLLDYIAKPRKSDYSSFGYDIYLPNVIPAFLSEVHGVPEREARGLPSEAISPAFYDAAWTLCRHGILRPGIKRTGAQSAGEGDGYSVTGMGRTWVADGASYPLVVDTTRVNALFAKLSAHFGPGFQQRANEAVRCHAFGCYLASCAMCGAAAESMLLAVAIAKTRNEERTLKMYHAPHGRRNVVESIVSGLKPSIASPFRSATGLLSYWRDEAAHGMASEISEIEAHDAIARLMRFAQFASDNWDLLTTKEEA